MASEWCEEQDIFSAIAPLSYASTALGFAPYTCNSYITPENRLHISRFYTALWLIIYTVLTLLFFTALFICELTLKLAEEFATGEINTVVFIMGCALFGFATLFSQIIGLSPYKQKLQLVLVKIARIDQILIKNPAKTYRKMKLFVILELVVLYGYILAIYSFKFWSLITTIGVLPFTFRIFILLLNGTVYLQYLGLNLILIDRFNILHHQLVSICGYTNDFLYGKNATIAYANIHTPTGIPLEATNAVTSMKAPHTRSPTSPKETPAEDSNRHKHVNILRQTHAFLCDIQDLMNSYYGIPMLLITGGEFIAIVHWLYRLQDILIKPDETGDRLISFVLSLSVHIVMLLLIMITGQFLSTEEKRTPALVGKLLMHPLPPGIANELTAFLQQLSHTRVQLTAYGFFPFDFSFLLGFTASVAMYDIILLQNT